MKSKFWQYLAGKLGPGERFCGMSVFGLDPVVGKKMWIGKPLLWAVTGAVLAMGMAGCAQQQIDLSSWPAARVPASEAVKASGNIQEQALGSVNDLRTPLPRPKPNLRPRDFAAAPLATRIPLHHLVGLNETQAQEILGEPEIIVEKSPSRVWKYRTPGCELDLFLFPDIKTSQFYVLQYDVIRRRGITLADDECLHALRSQNFQTRS